MTCFYCIVHVIHVFKFSCELYFDFVRWEARIRIRIGNRNKYNKSIVYDASAKIRSQNKVRM